MEENMAHSAEYDNFYIYLFSILRLKIVKVIMLTVFNETRMISNVRRLIELLIKKQIALERASMN